MDDKIIIKGAKVHNLKNIDVEIPRDKLTVLTGLSGSGKSSLAFDTIYAEGQRRYVESLSSYARQFLGVMNKPDVESIKGLSPAISIEQKSISHNPRSTVGTITEIYDYLRLLYARVGVPHCPLCGQEISSQDAESIVKNLIKEYGGSKATIMAPVVRGKKGNYEKLFVDLNQRGYAKVRVDGEETSTADWFGLKKKKLGRYNQHNIEVLIGKTTLEVGKKGTLRRLVETALSFGDGLVLAVIEKRNGSHSVGKAKSEEKIYSKHLSCPSCELSFEKMEPAMFSFNSPFGACQVCHGLGFIQKFDPNLIIPDKTLSLAEGAIAAQGLTASGIFGQMLERLAEEYGFDLWVPVEKLSGKIMNMILFGSEEKIDWKFESASSDNVWEWTGKWEGVIPKLERLYKKTGSENRRVELQKYMSRTVCGACGGARLKPEALSVLIENKNIHELTEMPIKDLRDFLAKIKMGNQTTEVGTPIIKEVNDRLGFLTDVGLGYLSLSRQGGTLSGGEAQRIRLATQIGSELRGVTYVLDEPSIGLHQRDNEKLIKTLKDMRDLGNTVIVVEHDEETINEADYVIDIGPRAGIYGGEVMAAGTPVEIGKNKNSLTGDYLSGRQKIATPKKRRSPKGFIRLRGAEEHNLKQISADFPTEVLCAVTGVSGSGKSTLVSDTLYPVLAKKLNRARVKCGEHKSVENYGHIDKVIIIDQSPIGRTPRSNPATYTGVFTFIRELFAQTKEAKIKGYKPGRFSFNVDGGRCGNCKGDGVIKIEMHFLPDVYVECEQCQGKRYNEGTLEIKYKDKTIADVLDMTVDEAYAFFKNIPNLEGKLKTLIDVGLGYVKLGQSATTLSGGEAQRIKLASELSKRDTGKTMYILDEPTTGLHFEDVKKLLSVLNRLVERGNTVLVIEHNLDVIKCADWIIDLGPEGGDGGGEIIAKGTPEEIITYPKSYTGQWLKKILS